jgi:hypothetical protein
MAWLHTEHGIPLVRMPSSKPTAKGFGWHRLGIDGTSSSPPVSSSLACQGGEHWSTSFGKTCPTTRRIHQFVDETIPLAVQLANPKVPAKPKPFTLEEKLAIVQGRAAALRKDGHTFKAKRFDLWALALKARIKAKKA